MKNTPDIIYLQVGEDAEDTDNFKELAEVQWCFDKIYETDIQYTRSDLHNQKLLEVLRGMERRHMERLGIVELGDRNNKTAGEIKGLQFALENLRQTIATLPDTKTVDPVRFAKWVECRYKYKDVGVWESVYDKTTITDEQLLSAYEKREG